MYCGTVTTFEQLRDVILEEKHCTLEMLADRLGELSRYEQGRYAGEIMGYQWVLDILRNSLKYGDVE